MILPENGAVVIIDDKPEEALPIIRALSKKGIAATYYQGDKLSDFPEAPLQSIRILFLDLQLIETNNEHQIAKGIVNILNKIIAVNNGPYILVIWSKNQSKYGNLVAEEINKLSHLIPTTIVSFNKRDCLEEKIIPLVDLEIFTEKILENLTGRFNDEDERLIRSTIQDALSDEYVTEFKAKDNAIDIIEGHIKKELEKAGVFHLFVIWENLTKRSAAKMINNVSALNDKNVFWEVNTRNVLKRMGIARVGSNTVPKDVLIKESINTLNFSLIDNIESEIKNETIPSFISLENEIITANVYDGNNYILKKNDNKEELVKNESRLEISEKRDSLFKAIDKNAKVGDNDKTHCKELIKKYGAIPYALNTKLHIEENPSQDLIPGNIYLVEGLAADKRLQYLSTFFKTLPENTVDFTLIDLEVSPICDYAQNKWKRSRTLPGVIYPANYDIKSGAWFYPVEPVFELNGKMSKLAFDFHLFNAKDKEEVRRRNVQYRLKRELLLDIIAQLSAHVNRPGISFIS